MVNKEITLAIDGDILVYRTALAIQQDGYKLEIDGGTHLFTSMLAVKKFLKSKNIALSSVNPIPAKVLKNKYESSAIYMLQKMTNNIKAGVKTQINALGIFNFNLNVLMCIGGPENFRRDIPLFDKYKDRKEEKPIALEFVRELLAKLYSHDISQGVEADDRVSMFGFKGCKDMSFIAVSEDKDSKQTPMWLYIPRKNKLLLCKGFGEYELIVKETIKDGKKKRTYKLEGHGRRWLYYQIVCGDPVDTYNPFKVPKYSDFKFYNIFKDIDNDKDCWSKIYQLFYERYGNTTEYEDWKGIKHKGGVLEILQNYVDVVHMQRWENDRLDVKAILSSYGII